MRLRIVKFTSLILAGILSLSPVQSCFAEDAVTVQASVTESEDNIVTASQDEKKTSKKILDATGNYKYIINEDDTATIVTYKGKDKDVEIPELLDGHRVTTLGDGAFSLTDVEKVVISKNVEKLGNRVFSDCLHLKSLHIPKTVKEIGINPIFGAEKVSEIIVEEGSEYYISIDGALLDKEMTTVIAVPTVVNIKLEELPESVTVIGKNAFADNAVLKYVTIPDRITEIGTGAFMYCEAIEKVTLGTGITELPEYTFEHCVRLNTLIINGGLTRIGFRSFMDCVALECVTLPDTVTEIDYQVFGYYDAVKCLDSLCIVGTGGTEAERYAKENDLRFKDIKNGKITRYELFGLTTENDITSSVSKGRIKKLKAGKGKLTVTYKSYNKPYVNMIAVKKKGAKSWKKYTTIKNKKMITGLESGKTYQVKVCICEYISRQARRGKWSDVKSIVVK